MSAPEVKPKPAGTPEPGKDVKVDDMETDMKEEEPMHVKNTVMSLELFFKTHWLPYRQDGTVDDELTSTVKN